MLPASRADVAGTAQPSVKAVVLDSLYTLPAESDSAAGTSTRTEQKPGAPAAHVIVWQQGDCFFHTYSAPYTGKVGR